MKNLPLLKSKLIIPDMPKQSLFCDRIKSLEISEKRCSVLTAPSGFGKTTAVLMCLEEYRKNVKWYRMDKEDSFLPLFYAHLLNTLFAGSESPHTESLDMLKGLQRIEEDYPLLNAQIVQDAFMLYGDSEEKIYLVLDDFHNVTDNKQIIDIIQYLIINMPECFSFVITSRTETGIMEGKLLLRYDIKQIDAKDLLFSKDEIIELISERYNLNLSEHQIDIVFNLTEGWIAGIYMMCHGMNITSSEDDDIEVKKGKKSFFTTFLYKFLKDIPEDKKETLIKLSILEDFSVTELREFFKVKNPEAFVQWIENSNLYIQKIMVYPARYRFHSLFRDELQEIFYSTTEITECLKFFKGLASYYREKEEYPLAIRFFLLAKEKKPALAIVRQVGEELFNSGNPEEMFYMTREFSEKDKVTDPYLLLFDGMAGVNIDSDKSLHAFLTAMGGFKKCKDYSFLMNTFGMLLVVAYQNNNFGFLKKALKKLPFFSLVFAGKNTFYKVLITGFIVLTGLDRLKIARFFTGMLDRISIDDDMWKYSYLMVRGIYYYRRGKLDEAFINMKNILNHPVGYSNDQWRIIGMVSCCNVSFLRMDKDSMRNFVEEFYALGEKYNSSFATGYGHFISAYEKYRKYHVTEALEAIESSVETFKEYGGDILAMESRLIYFLWNEKTPSLEDIDEAEDILIKFQSENSGHGLIEFGQCVLGIMHRRCGNFVEGERYLLRALRLCGKKKAMQCMAGVNLQLACLYSLWGKDAVAYRFALEWGRHSEKYGFIYWREFDKKAIDEVLKILGTDEELLPLINKVKHIYSFEDNSSKNSKSNCKIRIKLLGEFLIEAGDTVITEKDFKTRKVSGILKYIIIKGRKGCITREALSSIFWPDSDSRAANTSLRVALYEMRKTLSQKGMGMEDDCGFIVEKKEGFCLRQDVDIETDIGVIDCRYADSKDNKKKPDCFEICLEEICDCYDGELLYGFDYDDAVIALREYYSSLFFESLYQLCQIYMDRNSFVKAEALLKKGIQIDPLNEKGYAMLFEIYRKTERDDMANYLRQQFEKRFEKEMGFEPRL